MCVRNLGETGSKARMGFVWDENEKNRLQVRKDGMSERESGVDGGKRRNEN